MAITVGKKHSEFRPMLMRMRAVYDHASIEQQAAIRAIVAEAEKEFREQDFPVFHRVYLDEHPNDPPIIMAELDYAGFDVSKALALIALAT